MEIYMPETNIENQNFEDALAQLESIVRELESGKIKLDDAVTDYEKAVSLKNFCQKKLDEAKLKIEKIEINVDGTKKLIPMDTENDSE